MKKYFPFILFFITCNSAVKVDLNKEKIDSTKTNQSPKRFSGNYLNKNYLDFFIDSVPSIKSNKIANAPFDTLNYDKVIAFDYVPKTEEQEIITKGKYCLNIKRLVALNQVQANNITSVLSAKRTYGGAIAACFDPHLGLVFYHNGKVVMYSSICLECNQQYSSISIPSKKFGFSDYGRKQINDLLKQLNFSHRIDYSTSNFDK